MINKFAQLVGILSVLLLLVALFIAILTIWNVIDFEFAKEAFIKIALTFGVIFIVALGMMYIIKPKG